MTTKTKTDEAWDALCAEATCPAPAAPAAPAAHPFAKLGPAPYRFEGVDHAPEGVARHCALCNKRIRNLYSVADGDRAIHTLGSECILSMGNGFERHLVGAVKSAKSRFEKKQRAAREAKKAASFAAERLVESEREHAQEVAWLRAYAGNFDFYLSLKRQFTELGGLSENQWACVTRAAEKDVAKVATPKVARTFSLAVGTTIVVTKFIAQVIGRDTGLNRPHFAIEVTDVQAETEKAYKVKGRLSAHRTAHCCVCGKALENPVSVANGIGPICGNRYEVTTTEELQAKLATEYKAEVEMWVPKSQIKERKEVSK